MELQVAVGVQPVSHNDIARLVKAAAAKTGLYSVDITGPVRWRPFCHARWAIWLVLRERKFTYPRIAAHFGRDHSTIIHGVRQAGRLYETNPKFADLVDLLRGLA